jgi:hypothetical protein
MYSLLAPELEGLTLEWNEPERVQVEIDMSTSARRCQPRFKEPSNPRCLVRRVPLSGH